MNVGISGRFVGVGCVAASFASGRLFHLGAHGAEIIGGGNHREENDQHASQGQEPVGRQQSPGGGAGLAPEPIGRQCQQQPRQIE